MSRRSRRGAGRDAETADEDAADQVKAEHLAVPVAVMEGADVKFINGAPFVPWRLCFQGRCGGIPFTGRDFPGPIRRQPWLIVVHVQ